MQVKALRNRLILLGFALSLFGGFVTAPLVSAQIAKESPLLMVVTEAVMPPGVVFAKLRSADVPKFDGSDFTLSEAGIGLPDDFGVALEDSVELLRLDSQHRACGMHHVALDLKVSSQVVPKRPQSTSPPLLV